MSTPAGSEHPEALRETPPQVVAPTVTETAVAGGQPGPPSGSHEVWRVEDDEAEGRVREGELPEVALNVGRDD